MYIYLTFCVLSHKQTWYQFLFVDFVVAWHKSACSVTAAHGVNVFFCGQALGVPFLNCDLEHILSFMFTHRSLHQNVMDGNVKQSVGKIVFDSCGNGL